MKMKKLLALLLVCAMFAMLFTGCTGTSNKTDTPDTDATNVSSTVDGEEEENYDTGDASLTIPAIRMKSENRNCWLSASAPVTMTTAVSPSALSKTPWKPLSQTTLCAEASPAKLSLTMCRAVTGKPSTTWAKP